MPAFVDLTGKPFGQLVVLERTSDSAAGVMRYRVQCSCGRQITVQAGNLRTGHSQSCTACGRLSRREKRKTHGMRHHPVYAVWNVMRQRAQNPRNKQYKDYGGRGIGLAPAWETFAGFWKDMGETYQPGLSIDRIDNDGPYAPENCRWTTMSVQNRNKRRFRHGDDAQPTL